MSEQTEENKKPVIKTMLISDESLNRHGFRVMTDGIDLANFEKNPVCCLEHDTWRPPIGKWVNVRKEGDKLLGDLEFDPNDEEAMKVYNKYKDGYMNACSINIRPTEKSDDESLLLPGQRYQTITKCELIEVSAVTIPAQAHAVKLSADLEGHEYKLSLINTNTEENMEVNKESAEMKTLQEENARLSAANEALQQGRVEDLIALHVERGVITEAEKESLKKLALKDYDTVKEMLSVRQKPATEEQHAETQKNEEGKMLAEQLNAMGKTEGNKGGEKDERADWDFMRWTKEDAEGLALMEEKEPERFKKLCGDFEADCRKKGLSV